MSEMTDIRAARRREFAELASDWSNPVSRRRFLALMGASLALAGASGCVNPPREKIVPYVRQPEGLVPGKPQYFATAFPLSGFATGLLVESHLGRPTKVEGNPDHPASLGATDALAQASVLDLYDPNRAQTITHRGQISTWTEFVLTLRARLSALAAQQGAGLRILTGTVTSPTLAAQLQSLIGQLPQARWHQHEPAGPQNARAGAQLAFGRAVTDRYRFDRADVVVSLEADPLAWDPGRLRYARDLASRRGGPSENGPMSRIYAVESTPSLLGGMADHRLPLKSSQIERLAFDLAEALGILTQSADRSAGPSNWVSAVVGDLQSHRGSSLVLAGDSQSPAVHALTHALNAVLGNVGSTVEYTDPVEAAPIDQVASLQALVQEMQAGQVDTLMILGGNPAYSSPSDIAFAEALQSVPFSAYLGPYADETAALCHWHIPEAHSLETWSDARSYDGTTTIMQPLIEPLYGGKSAHELLAALLSQAEQSGHNLVKSYWQSQHPGIDFEQFWRKSLHDGLVAGSTLPPITVALRADWASQIAAPRAPAQNERLELVIRPDPSVYDGRFAGNTWLQELPRPFTKLTWENAALLSPSTAQRLGVSDGQVVELTIDGQRVRAPVLTLPGQAVDSVAITLGYGRERGAGFANGAGVNAYRLRTSVAPWVRGGLELRRTGERTLLATTQGHHLMEGREIIKELTPVSLAAASSSPEPAGESLYPLFQYNGDAWGMAIDLSSCTGCNACMVACQAENNVPVVGKDEVLRGREMHWLRVDSYLQDEAGSRTAHQPVPCMHCEQAPCELVCPVGATVHSDEGLNDMVYNRCVGTRYCSNNCPYKVRRFNFFQWADWDTESLKMLRNPDVTVRSRGVMEKCTYCVQRISEARIQAQKEGRAIRDGEILTACQASCPTEAIVFGNINDPNSRVAKLKADPRNYTLLGELNTRPRTTYLARMRNPNPALETE